MQSRRHWHGVPASAARLTLLIHVGLREVSGQRGVTLQRDARLELVQPYSAESRPELPQYRFAGSPKAKRPQILKDNW